MKAKRWERLKPVSGVHAQLVGDWPKARYIFKDFSPKLMIAIRAAARRNAIMIIKEIRKGIKNQAPGGEAFAPLHELTIKEKIQIGGIGKVTSKKALIRHGDIINALSFEITKTGSVNIGYQKRAVNKKGIELTLIASMLEKGITVNVTQNLRNYFASQGRPLKKETTHLDIPARPFFEPVFEKLKDEIIENYIIAIDAILLGNPNLGVIVPNERIT